MAHKGDEAAHLSKRQSASGLKDLQQKHTKERSLKS